MATKSVRPLRLTLDAAFKLYFKDNPHLQKSLLENFLPLPEGSTIESVSLLDAEDNSSEPEGKTFILDLKISILRREGDKLKQESANVEMQSIDKADFINRVYAYSARMYSSQARKGQDYGTLKPVYSLVFTAFDLQPFKALKHEYCHETEQLRKHPPHLPLAAGKGMQYIFIELSKFNKKLEELLDQKEAWCYILRNSDKIGEKDHKELAAKGKDMGEAVRHLWDLSQDELVQEQMEAVEKQRRDRVAEIALGEQKGREEGREEG